VDRRHLIHPGKREANLPIPGTRKIEDIPQELCERLKGILFDIDDTFTYRGKIRSGAFSMLWEAKEQGLLLLPITGRPAGWADHIARMWPVDGVIGENGAFYFCFDEAEKRMKKRFIVQDPADREENRRRLSALFMELQRIFPAIRMASDQPYRECDLAIDYCEDASPPLPLEEARRIQRSLESHGAASFGRSTGSTWTPRGTTSSSWETLQTMAPCLHSFPSLAASPASTASGNQA